MMLCCMASCSICAQRGWVIINTLYRQAGQWYSSWSVTQLTFILYTVPILFNPWFRTVWNSLIYATQEASQNIRLSKRFTNTIEQKSSIPVWVLWTEIKLVLWRQFWTPDPYRSQLLLRGSWDFQVQALTGVSDTVTANFNLLYISGLNTSNWQA